MRFDHYNNKAIDFPLIVPPIQSCLGFQRPVYNFPLLRETEENETKDVHNILKWMWPTVHCN